MTEMISVPKELFHDMGAALEIATFQAQDEVDRVYFSSTNHYELARSAANAYSNYEMERFVFDMTDEETDAELQEAIDDYNDDRVKSDVKWKMDSVSDAEKSAYQIGYAAAVRIHEHVALFYIKRYFTNPDLVRMLKKHTLKLKQIANLHARNFFGKSIS